MSITVSTTSEGYDYDWLKATVANWLHRSDLTDQIPSFVSLAEAKLNRELRVESMVALHAESITTGEIVLPDDYLEAISLSIGGDPVEFKPRTQFFAFRDNYFTRMGEKLLLAQEISSATDVQLQYYAAIPALSDANTTNWLLTASPDLYLYSTLLEAVPYMKLAADDARPAQWSGGRSLVLSTMASADTDSRYSGQALTISNPR